MPDIKSQKDRWKNYTDARAQVVHVDDQLSDSWDRLQLLTFAVPEQFKRHIAVVMAGISSSRSQITSGVDKWSTLTGTVLHDLDRREQADSVHKPLGTPPAE